MRKQKGMMIDIEGTPEPEIFSERRRWLGWFALSLGMVLASIGLGVFSTTLSADRAGSVQDWALGLLVAASLLSTWSGNRLQAYKRLYPPQLEQLHEWKQLHPTIKRYCDGVEGLGRRMIRAEFEACREYAETHAEPPFI